MQKLERFMQDSDPTASDDHLTKQHYEGIIEESVSEPDENFIARPVFKIEGFKKSIIFVDPNEIVDLDTEKHVDVSVVDVRPASILRKAIESQPDDPKLKEILSNIESQEYSEDEILLLDQIAACVAIDEEGAFSQTAQTEGFALILSALAGNKIAREKVDQKLEVYYRLNAEKDRANQSIDYDELPERFQDIEALKLSEIAFIHSTKYEIERQGDSVILKPHGHHSATAQQPYPRSTIHFTANGEVTSHMYGSWDKSNKLIVINGQSAVDSNGLPVSLNPTDTYWSVNPGQALRLESASIVEPKPELEQLLIIDDTKNNVFYLDKEEYTDAERLEIVKLQYINAIKLNYSNPEERENEINELISRFSKEYLLDLFKEEAEKLKEKESETLRKLALNAAMQQQGLYSGVLKIEMWCTSSPSFDDSFRKLASDISVKYGRHSGSDYYWIERSHYSDSQIYDRVRPSSSYLQRGKLEAQRYLVALGQIHTRVVDKSPPNDIDG